jgi:hypothetical protein
MHRGPARVRHERAEMLLVLLSTVGLLVLSTIIHYEALRGLSFALPRLDMPPRTKVVLVLLGAFAAHVLEIMLYSGAYYWLAWDHGLGTLGETGQPTMLICVYFSWTTYSSLGYGDVVPTGPLKILAGSEALAGLLLIGWTAAFIFISMERFWEDHARRKAR